MCQLSSWEVKSHAAFFHCSFLHATLSREQQLIIFARMNSAVESLFSWRRKDHKAPRLCHQPTTSSSTSAAQTAAVALRQGRLLSASYCGESPEQCANPRQVEARGSDPITCCSAPWISNHNRALCSEMNHQKAIGWQSPPINSCIGSNHHTNYGKHPSSNRSNRRQRQKHKAEPRGASTVNGQRSVATKVCPFRACYAIGWVTIR